MNISGAPNLKPFRDYDEHEVINLFAHVDSACNKGTFVTITAADGNTNVSLLANSPATPHMDYQASLSNVPSRALVQREEVTWKVDSAQSGDVALGMTLYDVAEDNAFGEKYLFRPYYERAEQQVVISGEAVPIVTRGIFKINGFSGTPGPNSGGILGPSYIQGKVLVSNSTSLGQRCGKFLTSEDADGYAIFKLEL